MSSPQAIADARASQAKLEHFCSATGNESERGNAAIVRDDRWASRIIAANTPSPVQWRRDELCSSDSPLRHECTPHGFRAVDEHNQHGNHQWRHADACESIPHVRRVHLIGDSFMRGVYYALILMLSGNYRNGVIEAFSSVIDARKDARMQLNATQRATCEYELQFNKAVCKLENAEIDGTERLPVTLCGGRLNVSLSERQFLKHVWLPSVSLNALSTNDYVTYGITGLHLLNGKLRGDGRRQGVNDPESIANNTLCRSCSSEEARTLARRRLIYMDMHARMHYKNMRGKEECPERARHFHETMPAEVVRCCNLNPSNIASVWDASVGLLQTPAAYGHDWSTMTHDGLHYWMDINLMKARALLDVIVRLEREKRREQLRSSSSAPEAASQR